MHSGIKVSGILYIILFCCKSSMFIPVDGLLLALPLNYMWCFHTIGFANALKIDSFGDKGFIAKDNTLQSAITYMYFFKTRHLNVNLFSSPKDCFILQWTGPSLLTLIWPWGNLAGFHDVFAKRRKLVFLKLLWKYLTLLKDRNARERKEKQTKPLNSKRKKLGTHRWKLST